MFDTTGFWKDIFIFILVLVVVYTLLKTFTLKYFKNKDKAKNIGLNIFLVLGILYLFIRIYKVIDDNFPDFATMFMMTNIINQALQVSVLALATTGIVLIFKTSATTNFAQGMIATFGAFVAAKMIQYFALNYTDMTVTTMVFLAMIGGAITAFLIVRFCT